MCRSCERWVSVEIITDAVIVITILTTIVNTIIIIRLYKTSGGGTTGL